MVIVVLDIWSVVDKMNRVKDTVFGETTSPDIVGATV
jgi:hypothetical protein